MWDLPAGKLQARLRAHEESVTSVAICDSGLRALSGSADKSIIVWNLDLDVLAPLHRFVSHREARGPRRGRRAERREACSLCACGQPGAFVSWRRGRAAQTCGSCVPVAGCRVCQAITTVHISMDGARAMTCDISGALLLWPVRSDGAPPSLLPCLWSTWHLMGLGRSPQAFVPVWMTAHPSVHRLAIRLSAQGSGRW